MTPWSGAPQASLSFTISRSLLKLMSFKSVMPPNHLILCRALLLPSVFHSIRVFSNELALHSRWPEYWNFSLSISPSNEYSVWISFRIHWFAPLALQGILKSPPTPQLKSINTSVLSLLYGPTLMSMRDCWINHSLDHMELCWQSTASAFFFFCLCFLILV